MKKPNGSRRQPAPHLRVKTPIAMLKEDHKKVKELFEQFHNTSDPDTQREVAKRAIDELKIHALLEEELFYPSVRKIVMDEDLMNQASEEHHVVQMLMEEIDGQLLEAPVFHAKFTVLAESVRHHIKEEETHMLAKLTRHEAELEELGVWMIERKQELERQIQVDDDSNRLRPIGTLSKLHAVPLIVRVR